MKKRLCIVLFTTLSLVLSACGQGANSENQTSTSDQSVMTAEVKEITGDKEKTEVETETKAEEKTDAGTFSGKAPSMEKAVKAAKKLVSDIDAYCGTDYDAFSDLYVNTPEEAIQSDFSASFNFDTYDSAVYTPLVSVENHYAIDVTSYIVSGEYPNTHNDNQNCVLDISYVNGKWKLDYSEETVKKLNEQILNNSYIYPSGMTESLSAGRNAYMFGSYMFLDSSSVFERDLHIEIKRAWQDEEGNVELSIWVANGTDENHYVNITDIQLTDDQMGEIVNITNANIGISIKGMSSAVYSYEVPASQVKTGTQKWNYVYTHVGSNTM